VSVAGTGLVFAAESAEMEDREGKEHLEEFDTVVDRQLRRVVAEGFTTKQAPSTVMIGGEKTKNLVLVGAAADEVVSGDDVVVSALVLFPCLHLLAFGEGDGVGRGDDWRGRVVGEDSSDGSGGVGDIRASNAAMEIGGGVGVEKFHRDDVADGVVDRGERSG